MEPRQHHILPAFYLTGFTDTGTADGQLHVFDYPRNRHYRGRPSQVCRERDFFRIEEPGEDPNVIETSMAKLEAAVAPVFQRVRRERRIPSKPAVGKVLSLAALIAARGRRGRLRFGLGLAASLRDGLRAGTLPRETWEKIREAERRVGVDLNELPEYDEAQQRIQEGTWVPRAPHILQVGLIPEVLNFILENLVDRQWESMIAEGSQGGFVTSDTPLVWGSLDEAVDEKEPAASLADQQLEITFPVTKTVALVSYPDARMRNCSATDAVIAHINSRTHFLSMGTTLHAEPDFLLARRAGIGCASDYFAYVERERQAGNPLP